MTAEDVDPANLTPAEMAQLRAEFLSVGMTPAHAAEAADILARLAGRLPGMEGTMDRMLADVAEMRETLDRMTATLEAMARPKH